MTTKPEPELLTKTSNTNDKEYKKIIIFVNGLPINQSMDEIIKSYHLLIDNFKKTHANLKIELCFNTYNCVRTQPSGAKWGRMDSELNNTYKINNKNLDNLNIFDIEIYNKEITLMEEKQLELKIPFNKYYYHPQWLLNKLSINKYLNENISQLDGKYIFIKTRPDRIYRITNLINTSIDNYEDILNNNYLIHDSKCGVCGHNHKEDGIIYNYIMNDMNHIMNLNVLNIYKDLWNNLLKIHSNETFLKCVKYDVINKKYNLFVNQETKLCFYLKLNNIKIYSIQ